MKNKKLLSAVLTLALAASPALLLSGCSSTVTYVDNNGNAVDASKAESSEGSPDSDSSSDDGSDTPVATPADTDSSVDASKFGLTDKIEDGTILHAWSWSFNTIKESMADIAAAGYSSIQTSPANICVVGEKGGMQLYGKGKWYYHYQPTNWKIGNYQLGTEDDFKAMCAEADKYGIKIIVDVVPNHTANEKRKVEQEFIDAVGGEDELYHKNASKSIGNYGDRLQCTTYTLTGLHDVNTENPKFQEYFLSYMNQLIADGADGFRYDTAKHIGLPDDPKDEKSPENNFWDIIKKTDKADTIFNYGEVLQGDNERVADYINTIGHTTASLYGGAVRGCIQRGKMLLLDLEDFKVGGSDKVVTWVESHDNYTGDNSYTMTDDQIVLGWAVIAAKKKGIPCFLMTNFTWIEQYESFVPDELLNCYKDAYRMADKVIYFDLANKESRAFLGEGFEVGFSARPFDPAKVKAIKDSSDKPIVLITCGASNSGIDYVMDVSDLPYTFILTRSLKLKGDNVRYLDPKVPNTQDYVAAADYCIAKAGWSTVAEFVTAGTHTALLERDDTAEDTMTINQLKDRHLAISVKVDELKDLKSIIDKMDHFDWSTEFYENEYSRIADVILGNI